MEFTMVIKPLLMRMNGMTLWKMMESQVLINLKLNIIYSVNLTS